MKTLVDILRNSLILEARDDGLILVWDRARTISLFKDVSCNNKAAFSLVSQCRYPFALIPTESRAKEYGSNLFCAESKE